MASSSSSGALVAQVVKVPLRDREVVGSIPSPKALKMVPVAILLGAQHYKACTGFFSPNIYEGLAKSSWNLLIKTKLLFQLLSNFYTIKIHSLRT